MRAFLSAHHCCAQAWLLSCCHLYQLWTHKNIWSWITRKIHVGWQPTYPDFFTWPRPKARGRVLNLSWFFFFTFLLKSVLQIGTLEALIGRKSAILRCWLVCARCILITCSCVRSFQLEKHEIVVLTCQVGPFHLTLTQINSEINCIQ